METYTIEDLVWAIAADKGQFSLFFARCNYGKLRDEMMQQLRESCEISEMELQAGDESLYRKLKAFVAQENPTALMVYGFENVENIVELLASTNNLREKFVADFLFPIVFWVNDTAIGRFEELAMDFKSFGKPISLPITEEAVRVNLQDTIEFFFQEILKVGGDEFIANEAILGSAYRSEIDSALADLRQFETGLSREIEGGLELIRGREAFAKKQIEEARSHYKNTAHLWQDIKDILPLKEAVLLFHLGTCDRFSAEEAEEKEEQQNYWLKVKKSFASCLEKLQEDSAANFINELGEAFLNLQDWQSLKDLGLRSVELQKKCNNSVQLARTYGFLAQVAIQEKNWQEAKIQVEAALETIDTLPLAERRYKAVYLLLSAQVQEYLGERDRSVKDVEEGIAIGIDGKPYYFLQLLKELRQLYFSRKYYLEAYKIKIEYQSIRQQYGLTAFVGAGRVKASKTQNYKVSGRQGDINRLMNRIVNPKNKLTIIYGQSGVGKSSLVEAGLVPTLRERKRIDNRDVLVVNLRVYTTWIEGLQRALVEEVGKQDRLPNMLTDNSSLAAILEQLDVNGKNYVMTVLVFDQFEEFFFVSQTPARRRQFFEFFCDCLDRVFVKVVLSLREDYLYLLLQGTRNLDLSAINNNILDKDILYYVGNFSKQSAIAVIDELTCNSRFRLESDLTARLVEDLATELDEVRPIELQITGAQLQGENIRTLRQYQQIEKEPKEKLVREYLEDVVRSCGQESQDITRLVLSLLVDEKSNTRPLKTKQDLEAALASLRIKEKIKKLTLILDIFVLSGLVVLLPEKPEDRYQLVHDYLVDVIRQQQGASLLAQLRQAEEKIKQEKIARLKLLKKALVGAVVGLIGLAGIASLAIFYAFEARTQKIVAKNQEIVALSQSSKAYHSHNSASLDSLQEALKAMIQVKQTERDIESNNRLMASLMLHQAIYIPRIRESNRLEGHQNAVHKVVWDPDGKTLASTSWDKTVRIWSREGELLHTLEGHQDGVFGVAWSPNGKTLASASGDKTVRIWSREGELLHTLKGHQDRVINIGWSSDGNTFASTSWDKTVKIWSREGELLHTLEGHQDGVIRVMWSPDDKTLASASGDKTVKIWSRQGELIHTLKGHQDRVIRVVWSPDGKTLVSASGDKTVKIWSREGELLHTFKGHQDKVYSIAWSPDGKILASAGQDKTVRIWSREGELLHTLEGHYDAIFNIVWSPDGKILASAGQDKTIRIWSREGELLHILEGHQHTIPSVAWNPDGKTLASASWDKTVKIWSRQEEFFLNTLEEHQDAIFSIVWSPDGRTLASASRDKTVKIWSRQGEPLYTLEGHQKEVLDVVWSPDGKTLASASWDKTVRIWSREGKLLHTLEGHQDAVFSIGWSPDGKVLTSTSKDKTVKIWSREGKLLHTLEGHQDAVFSIGWSPDGKALASASGDKTVKIWSREGELLHTLEGHQYQVYGVAWSPDGKALASASGENTIKIWSREGELLHTLEGHQDAVFSIAWNPDGKTLASASWDKTIKIWSREGELLHTLEGHQDRVFSVAWNPDGKLLASASGDKSIILWLDWEELLLLGCDRVKDYTTYNGRLTKQEKKICNDILQKATLIDQS